jgi:HEPN domain-containing protein
MDASLTHLPPRKQEDLRRLTALIRERCPAVEMVILFGSYARGDWKEAKDLAPDRRSGHASDYDILAVTNEDEGCDWHTLSRAAEALGLSAWPRIIHHDIGYLNGKLQKGHYFFSDIVAEGKMLYDSGVFGLAEAKALSPSERLAVAREHYEHWFARVEQFYEGYRFNLSKGWRELAAFSLHQSAEAAYKTALLVFTNYIPDEHYLGLLGNFVAEVDPAFADVFAFKVDFEKDAFDLLEYAYIGARYDKRYTIDEASLNYLAERVAALAALTRERCQGLLSRLEQQAEA